MLKIKLETTQSSQYNTNFVKKLKKISDISLSS